MANLEREIQLKFRVTAEGRALIEQKMEQLGTTNMAAYLRKMAVDGYVVNLELPELREMVSLLRRSSNNLNQLARRVHETGRFYDADLEELRQSYDGLCGTRHRKSSPLWQSSNNDINLQDTLSLEVYGSKLFSSKSGEAKKASSPMPSP